MLRNDLYVKKKKSSTNMDHTDIWDDSKLSRAYDRAVSLANAEIAKRVAMSTNSTNQEASTSKTQKKQVPNSKPMPSPAWTPGMSCRAIYHEDGEEYEALITKIVDDETCVVKFLGYENSETVQLSTLTQSHGKQAQMKQIQDAMLESDDGTSEVNTSDRSATPASVASHQKNAPKAKNKRSTHKTQYAMPPEMPFPMPSQLPHSMNFASMPVPPPPMALLHSDGNTTEDEAMSSMLLSWYMNGYATGYYQGLKEANRRRRSYY